MIGETLTRPVPDAGRSSLSSVALSAIAVAGLAAAPGMARATVTYDFEAWIQTNGERGFTNAAPFQLTAGPAGNQLTLTATAFESPGDRPSHVYMDGSFNGFIGGMGVCSVLTTGSQCTPSNDDNVSVDGGNEEKLVWEFSQNIDRIALTLRDSEHYLFNGLDTPGGPSDPDSGQFEFMYGASAWQVATTDAYGMYTLLLDGSSNLLKFRPVAAGLENQFYIAMAEVAPIPLPPAVWLLLSGLAGLGAMGRRRA